MCARMQVVLATVRQRAGLWWSIALGFTVLYYLCLMLGLIMRFGDWPNYINLYDWLASVKTIVVSTPSWRDSVMIIKDEWLLEIGFMNYDYGVGISEWSLFLAPVKILGVFFLGAVLATNYQLLRVSRNTCSTVARRSSRAATGVGASLVALASITLSWVVCCSTPTWVVGLAMMGLGVSAALWLEPIGPWISAIGFATLLIATYIAAGPVAQQQEQRTPAY